MEAYKQYVDYIMSGAVAETAYILSIEGVLCGTNLPIKQMPKYEFNLEDEKDPNVTHKVVVDERVNLLQAVANKGVPKNKAGIRLYNQKYYLTSYQPSEEHKSGVATLYLKKSKGGACVAITKKFILIGTFNSDLKMQNGVPQNPGELNKRVQTLAQNIMKQGS